MPKRIDLASTCLRRSARLANKPKRKYGLFADFLLAVIGACEVDINPHIFLTWANQYTQEINRKLDGILNHFGPMVFAENKEQNESYTFTDMLLQPDKWDFILVMIKDIESHEARSHWTLMKKS